MRTWTRAIVAIVGITVAVEALMLVSGMGPDVILVTSLGGLVGVCVWFIAELSATALGSDGVPSALAPPPPVRADRRVARLRSGLAYGRQNDAAFDRIRDSLVELIDDQLLAAHDIDRRRNPTDARAVLGPELAAFVDDEHSAEVLARPRTLVRIVTLIEQL